MSSNEGRTHMSDYIEERRRGGRREADSQDATQQLLEALSALQESTGVHAKKSTSALGGYVFAGLLVAGSPNLAAFFGVGPQAHSASPEVISQTVGEAVGKAFENETYRAIAAMERRLDRIEADRQLREEYERRERWNSRKDNRNDQGRSNSVEETARIEIFAGSAPIPFLPKPAPVPPAALETPLTAGAAEPTESGG